ncbi:expressed unknown protein [Seminavis robusta]|uniref:Uncharacterized protein n=1 Tax=Seminavis robusta TaxID=568900 RepID=A0A9N8DKR9_9STRA|nr:expressed unknown protein [Seminavis robusta]|eukprot:Sro209_g087300.1 n/a (189) ;mRNA; r:27986-28552
MLPRRYSPRHNRRNFILSCENGNANDLRTLINQHGCSPNLFGSKEATRVSPGDPLGYYVFKHHRKVKKGRCPRIIVSTDRTPLHICIRKGRAGCARLLVEAGASLDEPGKNGHSATHLMGSMRPTWSKWWPQTQTRLSRAEQMDVTDFQMDAEADDDDESTNSDDMDSIGEEAESHSQLDAEVREYEE